MFGEATHYVNDLNPKQRGFSAGRANRAAGREERRVWQRAAHTNSAANRSQRSESVAESEARDQSSNRIKSMAPMLERKHIDRQ